MSYGTCTVELTESEIILIGHLLAAETKKLNGRVGTVERAQRCDSIFDKLLSRAKFNWFGVAVNILNRLNCGS